jgi:hypothetical protein
VECLNCSLADLVSEVAYTAMASSDKNVFFFANWKPNYCWKVSFDRSFESYFKTVPEGCKWARALVQLGVSEVDLAPAYTATDQLYGFGDDECGRSTI